MRPTVARAGGLPRWAPCRTPSSPTHASSTASATSATSATCSCATAASWRSVARCAGPAPRSSTAAGRCSCRASPTRTSTRCRAGSNGCAATSAACRHRADYLAHVGVVRRRPARPRLGAGRRLGDGGLPRRHADRGRARRGRAPTARPSCPTATTTARGSTAARSRSPASPATPPTRPTAASSATPTGEPTGTLHEGAMGLVPRLAPDGHGRRATTPGCSRASATCSRWGSPAGRTRSSGVRRHAGHRADLPARPRAGRPHAAVVGALWWDRERGLEQVAELVEKRRRTPTGGSPRPRQDHAGRRRRELHRRAASSPTSTGAGTRRPTPASPSSTRARCAAYVAALDAAGFQVHVHASATAACARRSTRSTARRTAAAPPPRRAPPAGAPRRRAAVRRARRRGQHPGAVGLPRRPDGRPDLPVPRRGAGGAGSTPSATSTAPAPASSPAATGRSAPRTRSRPSTSRSTGWPTGSRAAGSRAVPPRAGAGPRDRLRGVHLRARPG